MRQRAGRLVKRNKEQAVLLQFFFLLLQFFFVCDPTRFSGNFDWIAGGIDVREAVVLQSSGEQSKEQELYCN